MSSLNISVLVASIAPALGALLLDAILGVVQAAKSHTLSLQKLPGIAEDAVVPILVGVGGTLLQAAVGGNGEVGAAVVVIANTVTARALSDAKSKLTALLT